MRAEIIHEKPLSGEYPERFFGSIRENSMWVLFSNAGVDEWVGIFAHSFSYNGHMKIQSLADDQFLIFSGGAIYLVDAKSRELLHSYSDEYFSDAVYDEKRKQMITSNYTHLHGISGNQTVWVSKRIALDGIRDLTIIEDHVFGLARFEDGELEPFEFDCVSHQVSCKRSVF